MFDITVPRIIASGAAKDVTEAKELLSTIARGAEHSGRNLKRVMDAGEGRAQRNLSRVLDNVLIGHGEGHATLNLSRVLDSVLIDHGEGHAQRRINGSR